jgi:asparagine synthase (glutamine-hydrolysing)
VTIDGQGADELFAGYSQYYGVFLLEALSKGKLNKIIDSMIRPGNNFAHKKEILLSLVIMLSRLTGKKMTSFAFKRKHAESSWINSDFWKTYSDRIPVLQNKIKSDLNSTLLKDFHGSTLKTMLRVGDRNSMNFSVESRVPFCDDYRIEQLAFNIPSDYKIRNNLSKYILRETYNNLLSNEISFRKDKKGFSIPERKWLLDLGEEVLPYFSDTLNAYLNISKIKSEWMGNLNNTSSTRWSWRLLSFAVWMKNFKKS